MVYILVGLFLGSLNYSLGGESAGLAIQADVLLKIYLSFLHAEDFTEISDDNEHAEAAQSSASLAQRLLLDGSDLQSDEQLSDSFRPGYRPAADNDNNTSTLLVSQPQSSDIIIGPMWSSMSGDARRVFSSLADGA